jgi:hypothetical protein
MSGPGPRPTWLPRLLHRLTLAVSVSLLGVVLLAPFLDPVEARPRGGRRLLAVFARDATVRRTALASSLGLAVTACVFFRSNPARRAPARKPAKPPPPAGGIVGA